MTDHNSRPDDGVHRTEYDADDDICYAIVCAVGNVIGDDPTAVDPLYDVIDPDALERFVQSLRKRDEPADGSVEFGLGGSHVMVRADGVIEIRPEQGTAGAGDD